MGTHLRATERHLPYGITRCYLPPDTDEHALLNRSQTGQYSVYLPQMDELTLVVITRWFTKPGVEQFDQEQGLYTLQYTAATPVWVTPGVCRFRIDPLRFLAGWRKRRLNQA